MTQLTSFPWWGSRPAMGCPILMATPVGTWKSQRRRWKGWRKWWCTLKKSEHPDALRAHIIRHVTHTDSNVGWADVGPTSGRQYRRWANVGPTYNAVWAGGHYWGYYPGALSFTRIHIRVTAIFPQMPFYQMVFKSFLRCKYQQYSHLSHKQTKPTMSLP